jgi:hypothetical protein
MAAFFLFHSICLTDSLNENCIFVCHYIKPKSALIIYYVKQDKDKVYSFFRSRKDCF